MTYALFIKTNALSKEVPVRQPARFKFAGVGIMILGMAVLGLAAQPSWAKTLTVSKPCQQLYQKPNFASPPLGPVPMEERVNLIFQEGEWYKVAYHGKIGWLHQQAFPEVAPGNPNLKGLLKGTLLGAPVRETSSDEVALGGKGVLHRGKRVLLGKIQNNGRAQPAL